MYICRVARKGRHVSHAAVHIFCTYGVAHCFTLLYHGLVRLRIEVLACCLATHVEEVLCLLEIFLVARNEIQFAETHLGYLMARHYVHLILCWTHLAAHAVGVAYGDIEERAFARGNIVRTGCLKHVAEVVELMAEFLHLLPTFAASPRMWFGW